MANIDPMHVGLQFPNPPTDLRLAFSFRNATDLFAPAEASCLVRECRRKSLDPKKIARFELRPFPAMSSAHLSALSSLAPSLDSAFFKGSVTSFRLVLLCYSAQHYVTISIDFRCRIPKIHSETIRILLVVDNHKLFPRPMQHFFIRCNDFFQLHFGIPGYVRSL